MRELRAWYGILPFPAGAGMNRLLDRAISGELVPFPAGAGMNPFALGGQAFWNRSPQARG